MTRHHQRGAALPETALVLTLLLMVVVGAIRVAVVGYQQVSADGAAFFSAHETGIKQTYPGVATQLDPTAATQNVFPRNATGDTTITPQTYAPPSVTLPNYGFDQTNNRHGGASLIQPLQTISTVTRSNLDPVSIFGGSLMTVTGIGVEPSFQETGVHGNIAGNTFGTQASFEAATDYFSQGENTPPYFGGFNYMQFCPVSPDPNPANSWNGCPTTVEFLALGMAEYLDVQNWGRSPNGIAPEQQAVFWETLYHQNVYAEISSQLPPDIQTAAHVLAAQTALNRTDSTQTIWKVYSWDSAQQGGFPAPGYVPGTYPLNPGANAP